MGLKGLSIENLVHLDMGMIDIAFKEELKRVVGDMSDRPGDRNPRTVNLTIKLVPEKSDNGICTGALVEFMLNSNVPKRRTRMYSMKVHPTGGLLFNPESPDDARQHTLDEAAEQKKKGNPAA